MSNLYTCRVYNSGDEIGSMACRAKSETQARNIFENKWNSDNDEHMQFDMFSSDIKILDNLKDGDCEYL